MCEGVTKKEKIKMAEINFEKSMEELENILSQLEKGELPLEESLTLFEKGVKIFKECQDTLEKAQAKITKLMQDGSKEKFEGMGE